MTIETIFAIFGLAYSDLIYPLLSVAFLFALFGMILYHTNK